MKGTAPGTLFLALTLTLTLIFLALFFLSLAG